MERDLTPPESSDACEDCGRNISRGKLCRECSLDKSRLEHSETE